MLHVKLSVHEITPDDVQPYGRSRMYRLEHQSAAMVMRITYSLIGNGTNSKGCVNAGPADVPVAILPFATYPKITKYLRRFRLW